MYQPVFAATPTELVNCLNDIDRRRYVFDSFLMDPKYRDWFQRRAWIRTVHHSTRIEGNTLSEEQVEALLDSPPQGTRNIDVREVVNYAIALRFVDEISDEPDIPIDERVIRHLNAVILKDTVPPLLRLGQYRNGDVWVSHPISGDRIYDGPPPGDVPPLMQDYVAWLHLDADHPVVKAAIAHLELVAIHPFSDGNGRTARALSTLVLQRQGYDFNKLVSLDRNFDLNRLEYFDEISRVAGRNYQRGQDITSWVEYFALQFLTAVDAVSNQIVDFRRLLEDISPRLRAVGATDRQIDGIAYALVHGSIRPKDYIRITGLTPAQASRNLKHLETLGVLQGTGYGRSRRYVLVTRRESS